MSAKENALRLLAIAAILAVASCTGSRTSRRDPVLAVAFTGPVSLNIRAEISPQSRNIATASHGEKLEVLQVRRRFVRVRTPRGDQGWTEVRNLLGQEGMDALADLATRAKKLRSQGEAASYSPLNVHSEPSRTATSFYRITEGMRVDVVGHKLLPKTNAPVTPAFELPKPVPRVRKRSKREPAVPPPPKPAAPALPENWRELSKTDRPAPTPEQLIAQAKPAPRIPMEDWSLVRTKDGKAGWVLTRNIYMAIPDEVAQYSEGARITSYFALADVHDGEETKHHWIWTTMREPGGPYDFDSFRIFTWVVRKHRYETAYIERRVEGFYPVVVKHDKLPTFSLILRDDEGHLVRRTYILEGYIVRKIADEPWEMKAGTPGATLVGDVPEETEDQTGDEADESKGDRTLLDRLKGLLRRKR